MNSVRDGFALSAKENPMTNQHRSGLGRHDGPLFVLVYKRSKVFLWLFIYSFFALFWGVIALAPIGHTGEIALPILKTLVFGFMSLASLFQFIDLLFFREIRVYQNRITKVWKWIGSREIELASAIFTGFDHMLAFRTIYNQDTKWYLRSIKSIFYWEDFADPKELKKLYSLLAHLSGRRIQEFESPVRKIELIKEGDMPRSAIGYTLDERLLNKEIADEKAFNRTASIALLVVALCFVLGMCILWYPIVRTLF